VSKVRTFSAEGAGAAGAKGAPRPGALGRAGAYLGVALCVFLLGLAPMWLKAREAASQRDAARRELRLSQLHGTLASAAIDARRGEYEPARQTAGDFFTTLRAQLDAGPQSPLTAAQREAVAPLLAERDRVITLLARGDPAAAERLSNLYVSYRRAVNEAHGD
jgi:hypothetical protein